MNNDENKSLLKIDLSKVNRSVSKEKILNEAKSYKNLCVHSMNSKYCFKCY